MPSRASGGAASAPIALCGTPQRLVLVGKIPAAAEIAQILLPDEVANHTGTSTVPLRLRHGEEGAADVWVRIGRGTPPGSYAATMRIADKSYPIEIKIVPAPRVRARPTVLRFAGHPTGETEAQFIVMNDGNTDVTIPRYCAVGIYDDQGIDEAFAHTYRQNTDDPDKLLGQWLRKLREGRGGLLKIQITHGAGVLHPMTNRLIALTARLPSTVKPGHSYNGIWSLETLRQRIELTVSRRRGEIR